MGSPLTCQRAIKRFKVFWERVQRLPGLLGHCGSSLPVRTEVPRLRPSALPGVARRIRGAYGSAIMSCVCVFNDVRLHQGCLNRVFNDMYFYQGCF